MPIQLIHERAEEIFLSAVEAPTTENTHHDVLVCRFSRTRLTVDADIVSQFLSDILPDQDGELYFFDDGDLAICWHGQAEETTNHIIEAFQHDYAVIAAHDADAMFNHYSTSVHVQAQELRQLIQEKLEEINPSDTTTPPPPASPPHGQPAFTEEQLASLQKALQKRHEHRDVEVLIVEDHAFSSKLLSGIFDETYNCHTATSAAQALRIYAKHAPDITLLDIELPDANGHMLAALLKHHDPQSYLVMATGSSQLKDIETAKANKVQGFVVKPYNKHKVMAALDPFFARRKKPL